MRFIKLEKSNILTMLSSVNPLRSHPNRRTPLPNRPIKSQLPPNRFAWEIGVALSLKILLLIGLWFLLFRWLGQPLQQIDITRHFAPKDQAIVSALPLASQPQK